jgi:glycosyltransferase domain-containing protein
MSSLNQLTLIILSYKRPAHLARNLAYWSNRGPRVIAFDGSPDPIGPSALDGLGNNVSYRHAPVSYRARLEMVASELDTPYVALLADDDFYLPSALVASVGFLENNTDYSACVGRPLGFGYESTSGVFGIPGLYGDMYNDYRIVGETPGSRMRGHMARYMPSTMYAVLRATNWGKTVEAYVRKELPVFAILELQMELTTAYLGKSAVLPMLGWLKSTELDQIDGPDISLRRIDEFHDLWPKGGSRNSFRSTFIGAMADVLSNADERPKQVVAGEIEAAMDDYVAWCGSYFRKSVSFYDTREYLKRVLPGRLKSAIISYLRAMRLRRSKAQIKPSLIALCRQLAATGTSVDMHELQEIVAVIQEFHDRRHVGRKAD